MASHASKLISLAGRGVFARSANFLGASARAVKVQSPARNIWYMSTSSKPVFSSHSNAVNISQPCGCGCNFHTQGDENINEFLTGEIKNEQSESRALPTDVCGFTVQKIEGAEVELVKKNGNETITVEFNVNDSTEDDAEQAQAGAESPANFVAKPEFTVLVNKGGDLTLGVHCVFPFGEQTEGEYDESIQISEVALLKGDAKWDESIYTHTGDVMDGDLYDMMLTMLEERGVTADFVDALVQFSTTYEHKQYVSFLQSMQSFVSTK